MAVRKTSAAASKVAAPVEIEIEEVAVPVQTGIADVKTGVDKFIKETQVMSEQFGISQAKVKEGVEKAIKTTEELVAFGQGNVEAYVKSSQILATGLQDISKAFAATAQASVEDAVASFKALSGVKSLKEVVDLQTAAAKTGVEKAIAESGKLTDATVKLAELAFAPLSQRFTLATEKFSKVA
jgi:phasin family protein